MIANISWPQSATFILYYLKNFEVLITNFITFSKPIFSVYYILQYLHVDVRRDLALNIHGNAMYIPYYKYVLSLKMAFVAEIFRWWLPTDKVVFRLNLYLFYLLVCLKTTVMPCLRKLPVTADIWRNQLQDQRISHKRGQEGVKVECCPGDIRSCLGCMGSAFCVPSLLYNSWYNLFSYLLHAAESFLSS